MTLKSTYKYIFPSLIQLPGAKYINHSLFLNNAYPISTAFLEPLLPSADTAMTSRTFHPFARLPKELSDLIWAFSIRPERPNAHFFTIFNSGSDTEWSAMAQYAMSIEFLPRCSLAAPLRNNSDPQKPSWTDGNRSAYLIDSGLWMACKESREAAEKQYQISQWRMKLKRPVIVRHEERKDLPIAPATGSFIANGEWWHCTTRPKSDLFCLQPSDADTIEWEDLWFSVPIFDPCEGFYVRHIALDYDPEWLDEYEYRYMSWGSKGTLGCAIRAATNQFEFAENLWFIDFRIRRRPHDCTVAEDTTEFRHQFDGNGCRFTEVRSDDSGWDFDHECNIFDFLDLLSGAVDDYFRECVYRDSYKDGPVDRFGTPNIGVLAYEVDTF